jgi:hypothetical protein
MEKSVCANREALGQLPANCGNPTNRPVMNVYLPCLSGPRESRGAPHSTFLQFIARCGPHSFVRNLSIPVVRLERDPLEPALHVRESFVALKLRFRSLAAAYFLKGTTTYTCCPQPANVWNKCRERMYVRHQDRCRARQLDASSVGR